MWLRQDTRKIDVCENFYKFAKVPYDAPSRITTRATVLCDISAREFVGELISKPKHLAAFGDPRSELCGFRQEYARRPEQES